MDRKLMSEEVGKSLCTFLKYPPGPESDTKDFSLGQSETYNTVVPHSHQSDFQDRRIVTLENTVPFAVLEYLLAHNGSVSHMGVLDPSYQFFMNSRRSAALCFKIFDKVAIVSGDPVCAEDEYDDVFHEFNLYRKRHRLGIAFLGTSEKMVHYAEQRKKHWAILEFAKDRVLNPVTNDVLQERGGKRIIVKCRQLLSPTKGGISLHLYNPSRDRDRSLELKLGAIYDEWCQARNRHRKYQAYITKYDLFAVPSLVLFIYCRSPAGQPNGFAALRWVGSKKGYHIDPCISAQQAPNGVTDLLVFSSMSYLKQLGVTYLSMGYEPFQQLGVISGLPWPLQSLTRRAYARASERLPLTGKMEYHKKFKPNDSEALSLYILLSSPFPDPRDIAALAHNANIRIRQVVLGIDSTE